jgi:hypothetical protein
VGPLLLRHLGGHPWSQVERLLVVPGGGPGGPDDAGYPLWTQQRTEAALHAWRTVLPPPLPPPYPSIRESR